MYVENGRYCIRLSIGALYKHNFFDQLPPTTLILFDIYASKRDKSLESSIVEVAWSSYLLLIAFRTVV